MPEKCTDSTGGCTLLPRVKALEDANRQHSDTHREIFRRLGDLESDTAVQGEQLKNIDEKLNDIKADQKSILQKVEAMEAKPAKRWEGAVDKIILAVISAVVGFMMSGIFPK